MKKAVRMLAGLCLMTKVAGAQEIMMQGQVKDRSLQAVAAASVSLLRAPDSTLVKTVVTDSAGYYRFTNLAPGDYLVRVTVVGFEPAHSVRQQVSRPGHQVPLIVLETRPAAGAAVTVTARKPLIEKKADRTVVNVDALISSTGSNALDLLERSPGVAVDEDGTVSLNGKQGVLVLIDDKPTYLSGEQLANYLRSLPSSALDKIELMPNPPARYDAAGNAGVINIRLKKNRARGFNGNISTAHNQGRYYSTVNSSNLNYRNGPLSLFGNFSYAQQNGYTDLDINRFYRNSQGGLAYTFSQNSYIRRHSEAFSGRAGLDYELNKSTTIGVLVNVLTRPSDRHTFNLSRLLSAQGVEDSSIAADNTEKNKWRNQSINLNLKHDLAPGGRSLTADLDYIHYLSDINQAFYNTTSRANGSLYRDALSGQLPSEIDIYAAKADYTHPFSKSLVLETGIKASYIKTDNLALYAITEGGITRQDYEKTNHFLYDENINAAYVNFSKETGRISIRAGLRGENTISKGHQLGNIAKPDSSFRRSYTNLFPTAFFSWKIDSLSKHQLNLSYGRRIDRPVYQDLNPFISPLDKFTLYAGNPFLRPSFTNEVSAAYTFRNTVTATLFYSVTRDVTMESISLNGNNYLSQPANLGRNSITGFSVNAGLKPFKWWTANVYAEVQNRHYEGMLVTGYMDTAALYFGANLTNQLRLGKDWSAEWGGTYRGDIIFGQVSIAANWQLNAGIQKKLFDGKASVRMAVRDIFFSGIRNGIIHNLAQADARFRNQGDLRIYTVALAYNFGKTDQQGRSRSRGSAQNEQSRVREG
ncbi:MAG TPA: outer membrane beta-barrel protein [Flavisolibacter sp.]|nr:outer membrane beta-barrel protein [Flavisolibacter sp.]